MQWNTSIMIMTFLTLLMRLALNILMGIMILGRPNLNPTMVVPL